MRERKGYADRELEAEVDPARDLWERLGNEFDRRALERLEAGSPDLVAILRDLVRAGTGADEVRRFARRTGALAPWETGALEAATRAIYVENLDSIPIPEG